jgi:hypothetical protein
LVEQRTENPRVGGSIPPLGTIFFKHLTVPTVLPFGSENGNKNPIVLNGSPLFPASHGNQMAT